MEGASDDGVEPVLCAFDTHLLLPVDVVSGSVERTKASPGENLSPRCHIALGVMELGKCLEEVVCTMGETERIEAWTWCLAGSGGAGWYWRLLDERGVGVVDFDI